MAIKGLTDKGAQFPRIGVLRKGGEKRTNANGKEIFGQDLDYFRFDADDDQALIAFQRSYGDQPRNINVYLPYQTTAENFQTWKEEYKASALIHRCDGETYVRWLDQHTGKYATEPKPCPGNCKEVGRLTVIIPELQRFAYVTVLTHSLHDIMELQGNLEAVEMLRGDLRGIPFMLSRKPRMISTPRDGKRVRVEKWLLSIEAAPVWVGHQLAAMQRAALTDSAFAALPDNEMDGTTTEIIEGDVIEQERPAIQIVNAESVQQEQEHQPQPKRLNRADIMQRIKTMYKEANAYKPNPLPMDVLAADLEEYDDQQLIEHGKRMRSLLDGVKAKAA